jgi:polysaccharide transporter, PST family
VIGSPVTRKIATRSAIFSGAAQAYRAGLTFVSSVILTRLLTPADFGLIAMVSACVSLVGLMQDLGLNQATIQREHVSEAQLSALFWLSTCISLTFALILSISSPLIVWFFGDSRLSDLTLAFAFLVFLGGLQSQHFALLCRELRFGTLAGIDMIGATASFIGGVTTAWLTSSYWSLFIATLASTVVRLGCVWFACTFRPGFPSFEGKSKDFIHFGFGVTGFNIANYFSRNADNFLIGRYYGAEQLGYYDRAYKLLLFPLSQIQAPLGGLIVPILARLQQDPIRYRTAYGETVTLFMILFQPALLFLTMFSETVFAMLFGPEWAPAAPIFRFLGFCGLHQVMTSTTGWLYLSQGRSAALLRIGVFNAVVTVASFISGLPWGALGVAKAYTMVNYLILLPVTWWHSGNSRFVSTADLVRISAPHAVATAAAAAVLALCSMLVRTPGLSGCIGLLAISYAAYGVAMLSFPTKRQIIVDNFRMLSRLFLDD